MPVSDPPTGDARSLLLLGVRAHEANDLARAESCYRAVLAQMPDQADALHLLGVLADQQGRHDDAAGLIRRAIALSPRVAEFHGNLGTALLALGDMAAAEAAYGQALLLDPAYVDGHVNLANLRRQAGADDAALSGYEAAVALAPAHVAARRGLAALLLVKKRYKDALTHLAAAIKRAPGDADLRDLAAQALRGLKRYPQSLDQHRLAIAAAPQDVVYRENYATTLLKLNSNSGYDEAVAAFEAVLRQAPDRIDSLIGLGTALVKLQQPAAAARHLARAVALDGRRIEALMNYAVALVLLGETAAALRHCDAAATVAPNDCLVLNHRGTVREHTGDYAGALADYIAAEQASGHRSDELLAEIEFKHGLLLLSLGKLREGWPYYRRRIDVEKTDPRGKVFSALLPEWDGVIRPDQRIVVWGEQGIGDQVIYAGMVPELMARGVSFCLACDPRLVPLFQRSFPGCRIEPVLKGDQQHFAALGEAQIGMGQLGALLRPTLADFPPAKAYLKPDPDLVAMFRDRYRAHGRRHVVGLSWRSKNPYIGNYKSIPLAAWAPVLTQHDILFVDLQYGDTAAERAEVRDTCGVDILHDDSVDSLLDLDRYAAQVAALDLVIGSSNSGIHVAGAVGRPTWAIIPGGIGRLWYWFTAGDSSPWYPSMRLFRQPHGRSDAWEASLAAIAAGLQDWRNGPGT